MFGRAAIVVDYGFQAAVARATTWATHVLRPISDSTAWGVISVSPDVLSMIMEVDARALILRLGAAKSLHI